MDNNEYIDVLSRIRELCSIQSIRNNVIDNAVRGLFKEIKEIYEKDFELESQVNELKYKVNNLEKFVDATIKFMSDREHFGNFAENDLKRFFNILEKEGLYFGQVNDNSLNNERTDIMGRLNNIN